MPLTMKQLVINCLAIYGAYRLGKDFVEDKLGVEVTIKSKPDIQTTPVVEKKKGISITFNR